MIFYMEADLAATKRYVQLRDGCKIVVHDFGGFGHPLLILHANGFHAFTYLPMVQSWMKLIVKY